MARLESRTWYVKLDSSGDAPTIQAAIDSARVGDEVLLAPGAYTSAAQGSIGLTMLQMKPGITLRGEDGATVTSIVSTNRAIRLVDSGDRTRIEGLTISGSTPDYDAERKGAGLYILGSGAPTISDCIFQNCGVSSSQRSLPGGAIACEPEVRPTILGLHVREQQQSPWPGRGDLLQRGHDPELLLHGQPLLSRRRRCLLRCGQHRPLRLPEQQERR